MNDRELLEAAAKAAGIALGAWSDELGAFLYRGAQPGQGTWNPLADDGDAHRLSVKLGMCVTHWLKTSFPPHVMVGYRTGPESGANLTEDYGSDPYAATRRAIVRAAAAMATNHNEGAA